MLKRDRAAGTNIHRFGKQEATDWLTDLPALTSGDKAAWLEALLSLALHFDQQLQDRMPNYLSRYPAFETYVAGSRYFL